MMVAIGKIHNEYYMSKNLFEIVKQNPRKTTTHYAILLNAGDSSKHSKQETLFCLKKLENSGLIKSHIEPPNFKVWEPI